MRTILLVFVASLVAGVALSQTKPDAYALALDKLGACEADLGPLRAIQAAMIRGQIVSVQTLRDAVEKANPTLHFTSDTSFALSPKEPTR